MWHSSEALLPFVGDWVRAEAEDAFYNHKITVYSYQWRFICYAQNERERTS
jgi:hypothetical protein